MCLFGDSATIQAQDVFELSCWIGVLVINSGEGLAMTEAAREGTPKENWALPIELWVVEAEALDRRAPASELDSASPADPEDWRPPNKVFKAAAAEVVTFFFFAR